MRKALIPMVASLAVCGAATAALIANTAHADQAPAKKPLLVAMASAPSLPATSPAILPPPLPGEEFGGPDMMGPDMIAPPDMAGGPDTTRAQFCKNMYARKV